MPTRWEISKGPRPDDLTPPPNGTNWDEMHTLGTGMVPWLKLPQREQPITYLMQNSPDKPVGANLCNFPSGLASEDILKSAWRETIEETCLLVPKKDGTALVGFRFMPPEGPFDFPNGFKNSVLERARADETYIRTQLKAKYPDISHLPIEWTSVSSQEAPSPNLSAVKLSFLGHETVLNAHIYREAQSKSFNIHFPILIDLTTLSAAKDLDWTCILAVDPERFCKNVALATLAEAKKLQCVGAPSDYYKTLKQLSPAFRDEPQVPDLNL